MAGSRRQVAATDGGWVTVESRSRTNLFNDASSRSDLESFLRFEPPTIGAIYDAQGKEMIELAREHRRVVSYDEMPPILRDAILAVPRKMEERIDSYLAVQTAQEASPGWGVN